MQRSKFILPVIVVSQFLCTSLWFAGNGVMSDLVANFGFQSSALGHLTSAVQFGFISGTLTFAVFTFADRFSPSKVFLICALFGSLANLGVILESNGLLTMLLFRFLTGFFLAGIYPVGMKIAADHYEKGLGKSLGFLVGALVLGTAFPHLLKGFSGLLPWKSILITISGFSVAGGLLMIGLVPDGPFRKPGRGVDFSAFLSVFRGKQFRSAAFGYFGHMWELYAFWAFTPVLLQTYGKLHPGVSLNIPLLSFWIIAIGGLACVLGSYLAEKAGAKKTAFGALLSSCGCCLIAPFMLIFASEWLLIVFLLFWGMVVIADSPLFSTLVAHNAPAEIKGTALTIVNCIGFSITIVSIQLLSFMGGWTNSTAIYALLAIGPVFGLIALLKSKI